jgi:myo-inositol-1(or 4)-monophosphatase
LEWGIPVVGVVGLPSLHEVFSATKDGGASLNSLPISTAPERSIDNQHFIMCCTRTGRRYRLMTPLKQRILGSAAYHLLKVADGSALAAIEATPKLWDLAAALLILAEAGGKLQPLGSGVPPFPVPPVVRDYRTVSFPLLAAANDDILAAVSAQVMEVGQ